MNNERFIEMTEEEWFDTYKPIKNHLETTSSFDGHMFETYGSEVEFVKSQDNDKIWMFGDGDDGGMYIWNGWHIVNRIGYFITEVPCPPDTTIIFWPRSSTRPFRTRSFRSIPFQLFWRLLPDTETV
mgnify:CR=1 FL=1